LSPKQADIAQSIAEQILKLWEPQPTHELLGTRLFRAALKLNGRERVNGDLMFEIQTHVRDKDFDSRIEEARRASQVDQKALFWIVGITNRIDAVAAEIFRSQEMITRKQRGAATSAEMELLTEERRRLQSNLDELKRLVKEALVS